MELTITARHSEITDGMKKYALEKVDKLERFADLVPGGELTLNKEDGQFWAEIHLFPRPGGSVVAKEGAEDMYAAVDLLIDKAERLLKKQKEKAIDRSRRSKDDSRALFQKAEQKPDQPEETYQDVIEKTDF